MPLTYHAFPCYEEKHAMSMSFIVQLSSTQRVTRRDFEVEPLRDPTD